MQEAAVKILRFAHRARRLTFGMSATLRQMQKRRIRLLILADDISENSRKKVCEMAEAQRLPTLKFLSKGSIGELFGREEIGIIGVTDENFAKSILKVSEHA